MENLKIEVNSEAESKEAQELFFELGYGRNNGKTKKVCDIDFDFLFAYGDDLDLTHTNDEKLFKRKNHKQISLGELRALVSLHKNPINMDKVLSEVRSDALGLLKDKEYLRRNAGGTYSYVGTVHPDHVHDLLIEIPEGAELYVDLGGVSGFYKNSFKQVWDQGNWEDTVYISENLKIWNKVPVLWQRHTQPEELPFVDDEPKEYLREDASGSYILELTCKQEATEPHAKHWIEVPVGVNFYYSFASGDKVFTKEHSSLGRLLWQRKPPFSINNQYAEIEKVRQNSKLDQSISDFKNTDHGKEFDAFDLMADTVNHPSHYASGEIECIDAIESSMTHEAFCGYLKGNVQKYMWRYENKGGITDLEKAQWYLNKLISRIG